MSALSFAFAMSLDLAALRYWAELREITAQDAYAFTGRIPRLYFGDNPCIPPAVLRGMVDRIQLRARVERDEREEAGV